MSNSPRTPVILVANNPFGHRLLTSQLLNVYQELGLDAEIILLCNGTMPNADAGRVPAIRVESFATRQGGLSSYVNLFFKLLKARWKHPRAVYHLRGYVAGTLFWLSRPFMLRSARYIYDPRGAGFIEWREAGRPLVASKLFGWVESHLIRNSVATIVTSKRFARLYRRLFGWQTEYVTIYNSTGFAFGGERQLPAEGALRLVYLGVFNHWHDMDEVFRVMDSAARQLGPDRVEIHVYTLPRFHDAVRAKFGRIECAALHVEYVNYHDIPEVLADKHVGVSVVRPTLSSRIASPAKISDYVALGLVPVLNRGIGDFDAHFQAERSAVLYHFGGPVDLSRLGQVRTAPNRKVYDLVSHAQARTRLGPAVERMRNG